MVRSAHIIFQHQGKRLLETDGVLVPRVGETVHLSVEFVGRVAAVGWFFGEVSVVAYVELGL